MLIQYTLGYRWNMDSVPISKEPSSKKTLDTIGTKLVSVTDESPHSDYRSETAHVLINAIVPQQDSKLAVITKMKHEKTLKGRGSVARINNRKEDDKSNDKGVHLYRQINSNLDIHVLMEWADRTFRTAKGFQPSRLKLLFMDNHRSQV